MAQTAVEIPDPLEAAAATPAGNADDLLAQMAGDEIDRLLAEAEGEQTAKQNPDANAATLDSAIPAERVIAPAPASPASAASDLNQQLSSEIDALFAALQAAPGDAIKDVEEAAAGIEVPKLEMPVESGAPATPATEAEAQESEAVSSDQATSATSISSSAAQVDESHAAETPAPLNADQAMQISVLDSPLARFGARPLPLLFRPLEWLNAPLDWCPETVREVIGKAAIMTLVNAAGVLAYVLIFRRHH